MADAVKQHISPAVYVTIQHMLFFFRIWLQAGAVFQLLLNYFPFQVLPVW
jgi:hypothetical protein